MKKFGAHISIAGGVENAPARAAAVGANAFAMFSKNQRQFRAKPITKEQALLFKEELKKHGFSPEDVLVHDSYLINMGSPDPKTRKNSVDAFVVEAKRLEQLGLKLLNFHPGAHLNKIPEAECIKNIAEGVNKAIKETKDIIFVLENTAGQGSNLGHRFEHLASIIELVEDKKRIGVCLDTCHTYAAGYDLASSKESFDRVIDEFDKIIGLKYLRGMHLNDSKNGLGSRKDRHESLGKGALGMDCFRWISKDKRFDDIPLILETPNRDLYKTEIEALRSFCAG